MTDALHEYQARQGLYRDQVRAFEVDWHESGYPFNEMYYRADIVTLHRAGINDD